MDLKYVNEISLEVLYVMFATLREANVYGNVGSERARCYLF
jgi:hypothetical protein